MNPQVQLILVFLCVCIVYYFYSKNKKSKIKEKAKQDFSAEEFDAFDQAKTEALEKILGPMDEVVGHALIPFGAGGHVDMYYFNQYIPGTVCPTMELIGQDGTGPKPGRLGTYELVTCTRLKNTHDLKEPHAERLKRIQENRLTPFEETETRLKEIMTWIGRYSFDAVLQPGQTADLPWGDGELKHLIFNEFDTRGVPFEINGKQYGLLLIMEIFPAELDYARRYGSSPLFDKLKEAGVYPYSDMDREPVV
jgi:hypothetical protein